MAKALISDELWSLIAAHPPVDPPSPKGGQPRIGDRATLTGFYSSLGLEYHGSICRVSLGAVAE
jgi:hypothetical protein